VHDRFGPTWMLLAEALAALFCILIALMILQMIKTSQPRIRDSALQP